MASDLVERLRAEGCRNGGQGSYAWRARDLCRVAADEIERLRKGAASARISAGDKDGENPVERPGIGDGEREALRSPVSSGDREKLVYRVAEMLGRVPNDFESFAKRLIAATHIVDDILSLASPAVAENGGAESFQSKVQPWLMECFGKMIAGDREERNHRFLEEALELVQSLGCSASEAHQLVDYTFGRPVGEPPQEVGGVMVTLAALCLANDLDMHAAGWVELDRIWGKVEQIRAKQAAKPKHSPLPAALSTPTAPAVEDGWHDRSETPPEAMPLLLEYHPWKDRSKPLSYQIGWFIGGNFREYGKGTDDLAYCERWTTNLSLIAAAPPAKGAGE